MYKQKMRLWVCFAIAVGVVVAAIILGCIVSYLEEIGMDWIFGLISVGALLTGFIWLATHY